MQPTFNNKLTEERNRRERVGERSRRKYTWKGWNKEKVCTFAKLGNAKHGTRKHFYPAMFALPAVAEIC